MCAVAFHTIKHYKSASHYKTKTVQYYVHTHMKNHVLYLLLLSGHGLKEREGEVGQPGGQVGQTELFGGRSAALKPGHHLREEF